MSHTTRYCHSRRWLHAFTAMLLTGIVMLTACGWAIGQEVKLVVSSKAGDRLAEKPSLRFEEGKPNEPGSFRIDEQATDQKIAGFGTSLLEAGLMCLNDLPPDRQESVCGALLRSDPRGGLFGHEDHTGLQRRHAGRTLVLLRRHARRRGNEALLDHPRSGP